MVQKDKSQYQVVTGPYNEKTTGLKFGYEYSSGNKTGGFRATKKDPNHKE
ncbi:hypothetical protein [Alkalihalobacillus sp. AL-G]|nr:hypothetical protein [Alkalihalobacillus sp. AL-G]WLD93610.1 hypothetical protein MOJ78_01330 [Alkalihalobacillus sp. AL-G]